VWLGPAQEEAYLRPETCQSIFVDFPLLFKTQRIRLPVGVAQVGRSFRNEIAPRQGLLRMRELNQAEVEVFFNPARIDLPKFKQKLEVSINLQLADGSQKSITVGEATDQGLVPNLLVGYYLGMLVDFYREAGLSNDILRFRMLSDEDRAFYSRAAYDLEARLSVGWVELVACNYRGDYDLGRHSKQSGTDFTVEDGGEKVLPHIFELSMGVDRSLYAIMEASLKGDGDRRALMIKPYLSPIQAGVFPLVNKDGIPELAEEIHATLSDEFEVFYDDGGSIGKRYARADEAGIPCCITIDYDSLKDKTVTIRDRDSRAQERVKVEELGRKLRGVTSYPSIFGQ
jgi:glycyl-tRNA synthetase